MQKETTTLGQPAADSHNLPSSEDIFHSVEDAFRKVRTLGRSGEITLFSLVTVSEALNKNAVKKYQSLGYLDQVEKDCVVELKPGCRFRVWVHDTPYVYSDNNQALRRAATICVVNRHEDIRQLQDALIASSD